MLNVPRELVVFVSRLLRVERRARGTRTGARALTCWKQAVFVLVWFGKREDLTVLGTGFGISRATAYRYRDEAVEVLAAQAPDLTCALERVAAEGWSHVVLDGTVIASDRCAAKTTSAQGEQIDLWYSGKSHHFGGSVRAAFRSGSPVFFPGRSTTSPPPARACWEPCMPPRLGGYPPWPTAGTTVQVRACTPRSNSPLAACPWRSTTAPTTHS